MNGSVECPLTPIRSFRTILEVEHGTVSGQMLKAAIADKFEPGRFRKKRNAAQREKKEQRIYMSAAQPYIV